MPHFIDFVVDGSVLFDIRIRRWDVCLGLVIVVIAHEEFNGIFREEILELSIQLSCQGFIVGDD